MLLSTTRDRSIEKRLGEKKKKESKEERDQWS